MFYFCSRPSFTSHCLITFIITLLSVSHYFHYHTSYIITPPSLSRYHHSHTTLFIAVFFPNFLLCTNSTYYNLHQKLSYFSVWVETVAGFIIGLPYAFCTLCLHVCGLQHSFYFSVHLHDKFHSCFCRYCVFGKSLIRYFGRNLALFNTVMSFFNQLTMVKFVCFFLLVFAILMHEIVGMHFGMCKDRSTWFGWHGVDSQCM